MPQHIGYVFETGATVDHLRRHRMPEEMAGDARGDDETGACERLPHDGPDRRAGQ